MLLVRAVIILVMAAGSVAMWIVVPLAWLFLASKLEAGTQPTLGPYLVVIAGIPISMVIIGKLLGALNRFYTRITGAQTHARVQMPWHKSMRGERGSTRPRTVLDVVMVVSVSIAVVLFAIWFFVFAGSSLPNV